MAFKNKMTRLEIEALIANLAKFTPTQTNILAIAAVAGNHLNQTSALLLAARLGVKGEDGRSMSSEQFKTTVLYLSRQNFVEDQTKGGVACKDILVEPALSTALNRSKAAKGSDIHWKYQHQNIAVSSIVHANPLANVAKIKVQVDENAQYYRGDQLDSDNSYSKKVTVEYNLVRQQNHWYIKDVVR